MVRIKIDISARECRFPIPITNQLIICFDNHGFDMLIKKGKDQLKNSQVTEVVYKLNCNNCDRVYIGQTRRHLGTRVKEHFNNMKSTSGNYSVVSNHRLLFNHNFQWDKPNILHKERNRKKREIAKMFLIKKYDNNINLQKDTENLNPIYNKLLSF